MSDLNLYRRLLDYSSEPIFSFDPDCRYLYANQAFADGIGRNLDEIIGKTLWDVFPENEAAKRFANLRWVFEHKESKVIELLISRPDGDRCYLTTLKPILDDRGRVSAVLANSKDISRRNKLEADLRCKQTMLARTENFTHIGSWEWDVATDSVTWSDELFRIFQRDPADGAPSFAEHAELYYPEDMPRLRDAVEATISHGTPYELELRAIRQDGETRVCLARGYAEMDTDQTIARLFGSLQDITERKQAEVALTESDAFLRAIIDSVPDQVAVIDRDGVIVQVNEPWRRFSMENSPIPGTLAPHTDVGTNYMDICRASTGSRVEGSNAAHDGIQAVLEGRLPSFNTEYPCHSPDQQRWFTMRVAPLGGHRGGVVIAHTNITDQTLAALALASSRNRYQGILHSMMEAYWRVDEKGRIVEVNQAICQMHDYSKEELLRMSISDFEVIESAEETRKHIEKIMREGRDIFESQHRCRDGRIIDVEISAGLASDAPGNIDAFHHDITERKRMEKEIRELAFHDPLTKLPNRHTLNDRLSQTMAASKRSGNYGALMMLDLDNFKQLNDAHGHHAGDLLLLEVARRLTECVRGTDTTARAGGDEFVVILGELNVDPKESARQAAEIAEKIRVNLAAPYRVILTEGSLAGRAVEHLCSASIGVVLFLNHEASQADLLKWADSAMYQAKRAGRNAIRFYGLTQ